MTAIASWAAIRDEIMRQVVSDCTRCEHPITGTPVVDPDDRAERKYCSEGCRDSDAEGSGEQYYPSGVAT